MSLAVRAASTVRQPAVRHVLGLPDPARSVPRIGIVNVDQVGANPAARAAISAMGGGGGGGHYRGHAHHGPTSGGVLGTHVADQAYDVIGHQSADGAA
jgi:hypothetical protein